MQYQNGKFFSKNSAIFIRNFHCAGTMRKTKGYRRLKDIDNQKDAYCFSIEDIFRKKTQKKDLKNR